jgi:methylmalonyl-CoA/ethylmalonyl-CoA epimerase
MVVMRRAIPILQGRKVDQIGFVVNDLEASIQKYACWLPGSWPVYEFGPALIPTMTYRDEKGSYASRISWNGLNPQIELIQPLRNAGPSIFREHLDRCGDGVQHLAFWLDELADAAIDQMLDAGFKIIQSGADYGFDGDGLYVFFDTTDVFGTIIEITRRPKRRGDPLKTIEN